MECSICLLPMSYNKVKLSCGHFLHGQCFVNYVQHKGAGYIAMATMSPDHSVTEKMIAEAVGFFKNTTICKSR